MGKLDITLHDLNTKSQNSSNSLTLTQIHESLAEWLPNRTELPEPNRTADDSTNRTNRTGTNRTDNDANRYEPAAETNRHEPHNPQMNRKDPL